MVERGITLIELLVALVIMALLTSIGLASYQSYIQRSRQAEAKITLLALLDRLDQYDLMMAEEEAERVEAILVEHQSTYFSFTAEKVMDDNTGMSFWRVQALPRASMRGGGSWSVDSRGYSCYANHDNGCEPQIREGAFTRQ